MSNMIVRSANPRGRYQEATLANATIKPGQCVKVSATTLQGDVRLQTVTAGFAGESLIIRERPLMGAIVDEVIPVADNVFYYIPLPGDECMLLGLSGEVLNAGTRANFNAAGKLIASVTGVWSVQEAAGTLASDKLVLARYSGCSVATV